MRNHTSRSVEAGSVECNCISGSCFTAVMAREPEIPSASVSLLVGDRYQLNVP